MDLFKKLKWGLAAIALSASVTGCPPPNPTGLEDPTSKVETVGGIRVSYHPKGYNICLGDNGDFTFCRLSYSYMEQYVGSVFVKDCTLREGRLMKHPVSVTYWDEFSCDGEVDYISVLTDLGGYSLKEFSAEEKKALNKMFKISTEKLDVERVHNAWLEWKK